MNNVTIIASIWRSASSTLMALTPTAASHSGREWLALRSSRF
ncbi:hypothetical protein [Mesorhizobium sp. LNHC209A00]|nr:hypothetical protein [Mesorhizobium sp. LNHC209A00]ESY87124.1 hypothetical protein X738_33005 [Mesorhizobium sp. LNHC209A00]